jgi:hypothetical protein
MASPNTTGTTDPVRRLLHDIEEARRLLGGISRTKIYGEMKNGRIRPVHIGSRTFIAHDELQRFIRELGQAA